MSILALSRGVAERAVPGVRLRAATAPTGNQLLETIGKYIPTDATTAYVAVAGGMATVKDLSVDDRRTVAIAAAVVAAFIMWVVAHRAAAKAAKDANPAGPPPNLVETLLAGWYEILTAGVAMFIWATAMPGSWIDWGANAVWLPAAVVFVASAFIGGVAALMNR